MWTTAIILAPTNCYPPMIDKIKDIAAVATGLMKLAAGRYDTTTVDAEVYEARINACKCCPHYRAIVRQCGVCGCFMPLKARLEFDPVATERAGGEKQKTVCPEGTW